MFYWPSAIIGSCFGDKPPYFAIGRNYLNQCVYRNVSQSIPKSENKMTKTAATKVIDPELQSQIEQIVAKIPLVKSLKIHLDGLESGVCRMSIVRDGTLDGIFVSLHGGIMMALADTAACFAIQTLIGVEDTLTTTDMNIRFLAPALGRVIAEAKVIKAGRTLCPCEISLVDEEGKLLAIAQVTYIRIKAPLDRQN